jgi:hypothetical protein
MERTPDSTRGTGAAVYIDLTDDSRAHVCEELTNALLDDLSAGFSKNLLQEVPKAGGGEARRFADRLTALLNASATEGRLGAEAIIHWQERDYQCLVLGIVAALCSGEYEGRVSNYRCECRLTNDRRSKRADLMVDFAAPDEPSLIVELKYVPLEYLRFPRNGNPALHLLALREEGDAGRLPQRAYEACSLVYRAKHQRDLEAMAASGAADDGGSTLRDHKLLSGKIRSAEERERTFRQAPEADQKYAEACDRYVTGDGMTGWVDRERLLCDLWHGGRLKTVLQVAKEGYEQCSTYVAVATREMRAVENYGPPPEPYVIVGVWRTSLLFSATDFGLA